MSRGGTSDYISYAPQAGDLIWLIFDPRVGHERSGRRPALVLSPKLFTERTGLAIVCPITSKVKGLPFEIALTDTKTKGAVLLIHIKSVDVSTRRATFIEQAPVALLKQVRHTARVMMGV